MYINILKENRDIKVIYNKNEVNQFF